eukprot:CAMPEP_0173115510 /NCGR_PEP_ID=MMETSP1102-20130122/48538_1 /TAXON_ID=49646 /ORGANISM="Geminigera sp., Strain Caron Lab Isolate" /LENGTH=62 /DNA_ID=CAMNT_0014018549 /DNA_START=93 /DNA_END=278 /DNA_ORIENTATION=+
MRSKTIPNGSKVTVNPTPDKSSDSPVKEVSSVKRNLSNTDFSESLAAFLAETRVGLSPTRIR